MSSGRSRLKFCCEIKWSLWQGERGAPHAWQNTPHLSPRARLDDFTPLHILDFGLQSSINSVLGIFFGAILDIEEC